MKSILGNFYRHLAIFSGHTAADGTKNIKDKKRKYDLIKNFVWILKNLSFVQPLLTYLPIVPESLGQAVWPDVGIKSSQNRPKTSSNSFYLKRSALKIVQILPTRYLYAVYVGICKKMYYQDLSKISPIRSHWRGQAKTVKIIDTNFPHFWGATILSHTQIEGTIDES